MRRLALALTLWLAGCGGREPYRLAVGLQAEAEDAAALAIAEINATRGIVGVPLRLLPIERGAGAAEPTARIRAGSLLADSAVPAAIVTSDAASELLANAGADREPLALLIASTASPSLPRSAHAFLLVPDALAQAEFLTRQGRALAPGAPVAILYASDDDGRALHALMRAALAAADALIVHEAAIETRAPTPNLDSIAHAVVAARPGVIYWLARTRELRTVMPVLRRELPGAVVLGSDAVESGELYRNPDGIYTGLRFARFADPHLGPRAQDLRLRYLTWVDREITSHGVMAYDAVALLGEALRAGARTRAAVRDYLASLGRTRAPYDGVSGPIQFDEQGRSGRSLFLAEVISQGVVAAETQ